MSKIYFSKTNSCSLDSLHIYIKDKSLFILMTIYQVKINDRLYSKYNYKQKNDNIEIDLEINPSENKLFNNDLFIVDKHNKVTIIESETRSMEIPGVLVIQNNKTYGRKKNKLVYKCIPNNKLLPSFLIPYEIRNVGFSKVFKNIFITFTFDDWSDKHPYGTIKNVIGSVDSLPNYYEYQLYCKNINISINNFTKKTNELLKNKSFNDRLSEYNIINRDLSNIYTIDPKNSLDYDDAFSIQKLDNNFFLLSIYIANVSLVLDMLNLWSINRVSTIYLPNLKKSMLPPILSDDLCSLKSNEPRLAFTMDILITDNIIVDITYSNCVINVNKNYFYEEESLLINSDYLMLFNLLKNMDNKINDSHDVIAYLMILMNHKCSAKMAQFENGIYRVTNKKELTVNLDLVPIEIRNNLELILSNSGNYRLFNKNLEHTSLNLSSYLHITSPIRRIVDLLNLIKLQENLNLIELGEESKKFYNYWIDKLDYINETFKSINKVQRDCSLLDLFYNNNEIKNTIYDGYIITDKLIKSTAYKYNVYIRELKLFSTITVVNELKDFNNLKFKLFLFNDEDNLKSKIKLQLVI